MTKQKNKLSWINFYIGLACVISKKSPDSQTQHGCVITDKFNRVLGVGYNGFPRGANDSRLPNTRPDKYMWMFHSERNALANCEHRPEGGIAYITGPPCNECLYALHQHGIKQIYFGETKSNMIDEKMQSWCDEFIKETSIGYHAVEPNLSWLVSLGEEIALNEEIEPSEEISENHHLEG